MQTRLPPTWGAVALVLLVSLVLAGCESSSSDRGSRTPIHQTTLAPTDRSDPSATVAATPIDPRRTAVEAMLRQRTAAVRNHDRAGFLRTVAAGADRRDQVGWYDRVNPLPLAMFRLDLSTYDPSVAAPDRYRAEVSGVVQLDGYDPAPVAVTHNLDFRRVGGAWRVVSDSVDKSELNDAPWDFAGTSIVFGDHVAVVVDQRSAGHATQVLRAAEEARRHDNDVIPEDVAHLDGVMVLAFADTAGLVAQGVDTHEIQWLGGLALPVRGPGGTVIERRVVLSPTMLTSDPLDLSIVLRHELTHVALVDYDGPVWMVEGMAEYVAWFGEPRVFLSRAAIQTVDADLDAGTAEMPTDGFFFYDDTRDADYALGWFSVRYLAESEGSTEPFALMQAITTSHARSTDEVDQLLRDRDGLSLDELAGHAASLIEDTFSPS